MPAKKSATAKAVKKTKSEIVDSGFVPNYSDIMDEVEKTFKLNASSMNKKGHQRFSTGLLMSDFIMGGGVPPGAWITLLGQEQSAKSTHTMQIIRGGVEAKVPALNVYDYEGSTSNSPDYFQNIFDKQHTLEDIFGIRDPDTGKWAKQGVARLYTEDIAETFFDSTASFLRKIPDKVCVDGQWYYVYDDTKLNRKIVSDSYSKKLYSEHKRLFVPTKNWMPQGLIMVDSYPAMLGEKMDVDEPGSGRAAKARMFAENVPKVASKIKRKSVTVVGVNQLRLRPGFTMGCLHKDTVIPFCDGTSKTIGDIVKNKIRGKVWSINEKSGKLEPKAITGWHYNGDVERADQWISIYSDVPGNKGVSSVTVTPNHEVYMADGDWKHACDVSVGDYVVSKTNCLVYKNQNTLADFMYGTLVGDCTLVKDRGWSAYLRFQDSENEDYVKWKIKKLSKFLDFTQSKNKFGHILYCSSKRPEFVFIKQELGNRDVLSVVDKMSWLSLALWYMDDGHFRENKGSSIINIKRFKNDARYMSVLCKKLTEKFGVTFYITKAESGNIYVGASETKKLHAGICKFIPEAMQYKLLKEFRGKYIDFELDATEKVIDIQTKVTKIVVGSQRKFRYAGDRGKYDITVEGNHNYMAGGRNSGFIVHNSPEYETCGETLKFVSSIRIKQTGRAVPHGSGQIEEEKGVLGGKEKYRYIHMKAIKNKTSTPQLEGWFRLCIQDADGNSTGFDKVWDTFQFLKMTGQLTGTMKKMNIAMPEFETKKPLAWMDFKGLISLRGNDLKDHCKDLKITTNPKIREHCMKQMASGKGMKAYFDNLKNAKDKESSDESSDD